MKRFFITILLAAFGVGVQSQTSEYYFWFIEPNRDVINSAITKIISIDNVRSDTVYAYANADELARFEKLGYKYTLLEHPSITNAKGTTMATTIDEMVGWDRYPTYEVYRAMMKKFEQDHPSICKLDSIGSTPNGHKLYVVKLSKNVAVDEAEVEVFYTSTIHGDETTGYILLLRLIDYLLDSYGTDSRVTSMLDGMAIYINPDANPDGTYRGGNSTVSGATRYNANNIDLNRNFPDPRDGDHPDGNSWQPESQAMMDFASARHFTLSANFHGGVEVANYPWDTWTSTQKKHADNNWYIHLSRQYADSAHKYSAAGYFDYLNNGITNGGDWYVITGGRQDYMNWWHHCREVTFEISSTKLLSSDLLPSYWNYNKESLLCYIESATKGFNGTIKNASGNPLTAKVFVMNHDKDSSHVYSNSTVGFYARPVEPGTWQVKYSASGYISQIHSIAISDWNSLVKKDIVLITSQPTTLTGSVKNAASSATIQNAKVELVGTSIAPVYTNEQGVYSFSSIPQDIYTVKISKPGYKATIIQQLEVTSSSNSADFNLAVSGCEGFESGMLSGFTCTGGDWVVDNDVYFEGNSSMRSAKIGNSSSTSMQVTLNVINDSSISFVRKVSSESNYDFLHFYIDGVEKGKWSGAQDWGSVTYSVASGSHTFMWKYIKDGNSSSGNDCAWIDSIMLPPSKQNVTFTVNLNGNPCPYVPIEFDNQTVETNSMGQAVFNVIRGVDIPYAASIASLTPIVGKVDVLYSDVSKTIDFTGSPSYKVDFEVKSKSVAIKNANVHFNGMDILTSESGIASFSNVPRGIDYEYTISLDGYQSVFGKVNVLDIKTINANLVPVAATTYAVTFDVKHLSNPIANATIVFNGIEQQTSNTGGAVYSGIPQGVGYSYSVSKAGYKTESGQVDVSADKTISVELIPIFTVTFTVRSLGLPVTGANIHFNGADQQTSSEGITKFENVLYGSSYDYSVSLTGYNTTTGQVDVTENRSVNVDITGVGIPESLNDKSICVWPNPFSDHLKIRFTLEKPSDVILDIFSLEGRFVKRFLYKNCKDAEESLSFSDIAFNSGSYIVRFYVDGKSFSQIVQFIR